MNTAKSIGKKLVYILAALIMINWLVKYWWIGSGNNEWQLEIDRNGVQVYSLKSPGYYVTQFKSVMKTDFSQNQLAASLLLDNDSLENCKKWIPECVGDVVIEPYEEAKQGDSILWTLDAAPGVFDKREFLIRTYASQNPETGVVGIDILSATNKADRDPCCLRITTIHNRWEFKKLADGKVEVSLIQDAMMGGFFPDFLINLAGAEEAWKLFHDKVPVLMDNDKYRNARFSFIK